MAAAHLLQICWIMNIKTFRLSFYVALVFLCAIFLASCNKKSDEPDPSLNPFGNWTRTYTGLETYRAQFNLTTAGISEWIMLDTLSTHTNSYSKIQVTGNQIRFYEDPDLPGEGIYSWAVSGGVLTLTLVTDSYAARASAIAGAWNLKNPADFTKIVGSWQKTMVDQGTSYRVKLSLTSDGGLKWEMIDPIPGHSNSSVSYTATGNSLIIYKDPDCDGNGYFSFTVNDSALIFIPIKDKCPPRSPSFSGTWMKIIP